MMETTAEGVWFESLGVKQHYLDPIARTLEQSGLELYPIGNGPAAGPGLLFFTDMTRELCESVRLLSRGGCERLLAVSVGESDVRGSDSWRLLARGASDVLAWKEDATLPELIRSRLDRWRSIERLVSSPEVSHELVGRSPAWLAALRQIVELARFTDSSALITGETGTGKELVARLIHALDPRPGRRGLEVLDCTTIVPELSGSEFFGHKRGAFTNAVADREGAFALADQGTLFLDEVGELPARLQSELLRVVQEGTYKRLGGNAWHRTAFRLICATHRDLVSEVDAGTFRQDFYYRVASWNIRLPSLNERREDILPLVRHFLRQLHPDREPPELDPTVRDYLLAREYPGNVRDLRRLVRQVGRRHVGVGPITVGDLPPEERPSIGEDGGDVHIRDWRDSDWRGNGFRGAIRHALAADAGLKEISTAAADLAVELALEAEGGQLKRAASKLRVTERALQLRRAACRDRRKAGDRRKADDK